MRFSEQFIADLLSRIDLLDVINNKVKLRPAGANFVGLCPFHQEKTPSFTVNPKRQFFHCFGCQAHGDVIAFIMLAEDKSFIDAVTTLTQAYGGEILPATFQENPLASKVYQVLELAIEYYQQNLFKDDAAAVAALRYLATREITLATIKRFKLGLAGSSWTGLIDFFNHKVFTKQLNFNVLEILQQAGMVGTKNNKYYDRFRNRIMFPIYDSLGRAIGFGARAVTLAQTPKYLNSPETIVFKKNKELYGFNEVKRIIKNFNNLIIVEGYLDFLTLFQANICNVVATLGTALNEHQITTILKIIPEIVFCFDGDSAGSKASYRAMEISLHLIAAKLIQAKHIIKFVILPEGKDPDLIIREQGTKKFEIMLQQARNLSDFFFDYLVQKYPPYNVENLNKLALEAKKYIVKFPDLILQDLWYSKLAKILEIDVSILKIPENQFNVAKVTGKNTAKISFNKMKVARKPYKVPLISNAIKALAMLLVSPNLISLWQLDLDNAFDITNLSLPYDLDLLLALVTALKRLIDNVSLNDRVRNDITSLLVSQLDPIHAKNLLLIDPHKIVAYIPVEGMEQEFIGAVKQVRRMILELNLDRLLSLAKQRELNSTEKVQLQDILKEF